MASVDLFGKPITGNQHSAFFNKLTNQGTQLSAKEQFKLEQNNLRKQREELKYRNKLNAAQDANLRFQVAQAKQNIRNPPLISRTKTKIGILQGFFK